jgi:2-polyprenyl-3-methyl-5-hydroxy-6-metoxy-1,4-benzoquinol methylase
MARRNALPVYLYRSKYVAVKANMFDRLDEFFKAASETSASIKESPTITDGQRNAFVTRHGTDLFQFYKQDPQRAARFASAMAGVSRCKSYRFDWWRCADNAPVERHFDSLKESFPWETISHGKVIDVGGGSGHMSVSLARVRYCGIQA